MTQLLPESPDGRDLVRRAKPPDRPLAALVLVLARLRHVERAIEWLRQAEVEMSVHLLRGPALHGLEPFPAEATPIDKAEALGASPGRWDVLLAVGPAEEKVSLDLARSIRPRVVAAYRSDGHFAGTVIAVPTDRWFALREGAARRRRWTRLAVRALAWGSELFDATRPRGRSRIVQCPVCEAERPADFAYSASGRDWSYGADRRYDFYRCRDCRVTFFSPLPTEEELRQVYHSDNVYAAYEGFLTTRELPVSWWQHERVLDRIEAVVPCGRILDVGCADLRLLETARADGWEVVGMDLSAFWIELARQRWGVEIIHGTLLTASLPANHFDAVNFSQVIEHMRRPMADLRQAYRVLRPGGVVAFSAPNFGSTMSKVMGPRWTCVDPPKHILHFTPHTGAALLRRAGFEVIQVCTDAIGTCAKPSWVEGLFGGRLPQRLKQALQAREGQLNEHLASLGRGEVLFVLGRRPVADAAQRS